nr:PREDICTED: low density lipoprotein receptor adapter protein 1-like isoform X3 [Latimeria chalumnae]|eukprot:XP_014349168.1 PREDICTED: low density lipoprotein receptor adapter protein 1-like isoform X3 [Latimeria chalumnae]
MDALKSAGRALIKSPSVARHTLGASRHETTCVWIDTASLSGFPDCPRTSVNKELPENWTDTKETLLEGMVFSIKYLGMTLVEQPKGEEMATAAIRRIVSMARVSAKKFQKVTLTVSPKGILINDSETNELVENVSIYRISYCTTDKAQDKVFAYVAQNQSNETLECHAFLCPKKKIAQAVTLTVAQAFRVALDLWEVAQEEKCKKTHENCCRPGSEPLGGATRARFGLLDTEPEAAQDLCTQEWLRSPFIASSISPIQSSSQENSPVRGSPHKQNSWEMDDGLDEAFSSVVDSDEQTTDLQSLEVNQNTRVYQ